MYFLNLQSKCPSCMPRYHFLSTRRVVMRTESDPPFLHGGEKAFFSHKSFLVKGDRVRSSFLAEPTENFLINPRLQWIVEGVLSVLWNKAETYLPDTAGHHAFFNQESRSFLIVRAWRGGARKGMGGGGQGTAEYTHPDLTLPSLTPCPFVRPRS